ncbi:MAG: chemotaxis protein CheX [Phycisphaerae bacterium]
MNERVTQALRETAEGTFESMAFIMPIPDEPPADCSCEDCTHVRVEFSGAYRGVLGICVTNELMSEVATNMLGLDFGEQAPAEQQQDALKELANVVCGNILPEMAGADAVFDVSAPEVTGGCDRRSAEEELEMVVDTTVPLEAGVARLFLRIEPDAAAGLRNSSAA